MELVKNLQANGISVLMYADSGKGKTTALSMLPGKTLIIDVDRGTSVLGGMNANVDVVRLKDDLSNFKEIIDEVKKDCKWDNICIDTVSELEKAMLTQYGRTGKNDGAPEIGHYSKVDFKLSDYMRELRNLVDNGVNIVVTAWEKVMDVTLPSGEKYSRLMPLVRKPAEVCGMFDIVAHMVIKEEEDGTQTRGFVLDSNTLAFAKDRVWKRKGCKVEDLIPTAGNK